VVVGTVLDRLDAGDHVGHLLEPAFAEIRTDSFDPLTFQQVRAFESANPA
jgi:hypothetical protein